MKYPLISKHYNEALRFAKLHDLEVRHSMKADELFELIRTAFPGIEEFDLPGDEPEPAADMSLVSGGAADSTHYRNDPYVIVNIQNNNENGGTHPVPICVNGDHILVKRNTDVAIPFRFFKALELAVQTDYRQEPNAATGKPDTIVEQRNAFQYSVKRFPSDAEIAAWQERTKDIGRDKAEDASLKPEQSEGVLDALANKLFDKLMGQAKAA